MDAVTTEELVSALDTMQSVAKLAEGWHSEHPNAQAAIQLVLAIQFVSLHLVDLAKSLADGADLDEAMAKMLAGDRPLEPETVQALQDAARLSLN